jgi:hypothetical protein
MSYNRELQNHWGSVSDHFVDVTKTIPMPKGAAKDVKNNTDVRTLLAKAA